MEFSDHADIDEAKVIFSSSSQVKIQFQTFLKKKKSFFFGFHVVVLVRPFH